jgi:hypothetical protein
LPGPAQDMFPKPKPLPAPAPAPAVPPTKPKDCPPDQQKPNRTYYHYSNAPPSSFMRGLWSDSAATPFSGLNAKQASQGLGIPLPKYEYPVTVGPEVPVSPISTVDHSPRYRGGLPQVFFPQGTPPGSVGPPRLVPQ